MRGERCICAANGRRGSWPSAFLIEDVYCRRVCPFPCSQPCSTCLPLPRVPQCLRSQNPQPACLRVSPQDPHCPVLVSLLISVFFWL
ncbi:hypothetical protein BD310DRAFT_913662, partial [Dichomitus squalens]